jgi:aminopeptidase N
MKKNLIYLLFFLPFFTHAQHIYTKQDSLRGSLSPLRTCFDVVHYDLNLRVDIDNQAISGYNKISYKVLQPFQKLQLDLFENLAIDSIVADNKKLNFVREGKAFFVEFATPQTITATGICNSLAVYYHGKPTIAVNPPWDGGFTFAKDKQQRTWLGVSCEGIGASIWYPNKDHLSDEPDSMRIYCEVPKGLICVANGNLKSQKNTSDNFTGFEWKVSYPINNYNVTLNIANYAQIKDIYVSGKDTLQVDYYVLDYNKTKAEKHFQQAKTMLACFEKYFGKYPFWQDGYALVETPYWGMEHQGAIAYGNNYKNLEEGFDFILIHESGHEYFGNSLSVNDHAEMWIHESFTTYTETLYMEYTKGYKEALKYLWKQRKNIANVTPMLGHLGVNYDGWVGSDIYYKGTWLLHSLRNTIDNDSIWFATLKEYAEKFKISQVTTEQTISFFSEKTGKNLLPIFNQYLRYAKPPKLVYYLSQDKKNTILHYRWQADEADFAMPMKVKNSEFANQYQTIFPTKDFQTLTLKGNVENPQFAEELFYFELLKVDKN